MTTTKTKYILSSAAVLAISTASAFGVINIISRQIPGASALDDLPHCTNVVRYSRRGNTTTVSSPIDLDDDTTASYVVPDQTEACQFVINLNGNELVSIENMEAINIGENVDAVINGDDGIIEQSNDDDESGIAPAAIILKNNSTMVVNDVELTTNTEAPGIINEGKTTLNNVTTDYDTGIQNNDGGELTINSGDYSSVYTTDSGTVEINGGIFEEIVTNNGAEITINDGDFDDAVIRSTETTEEGNTIDSTTAGNIIINGGSFGGTIIKVPMVITGGNFEETDINAPSEITGGEFSGANINIPSNISGGNFETSNINAPSDISGGNFESSDINAPSNITGGNFDSTDINEPADISGGVFTNASINAPSNISDGTFDEGTYIIRGSTITGGTFEALPDEEYISEVAIIIANEDGTFEIRIISDPNNPIIPNVPNTSEETTIKAPDTGAGVVNEEVGGKQTFIGSIIAIESAFLTICGYILFRLRKHYNVNFRRK